MFDWTLPRLDIVVPDYESVYFSIKDSTITVKAYKAGYESDGCTLSPDEVADWKPVMASLFHDPWYADLSCISKAWGWPLGAVRKLGDEVFACIMVGTGQPRWLARAYLTFIRPFGGFVRWAAGLFGAVTLVMAFSGCSGCANFPNHFNDQPVTPPQYQETTNGPGK
jgi:hypothetical protein